METYGSGIYGIGARRPPRPGGSAKKNGTLAVASKLRPGSEPRGFKPSTAILSQILVSLIQFFQNLLLLEFKRVEDFREQVDLFRS